MKIYYHNQADQEGFVHPNITRLTNNMIWCCPGNWHLCVLSSKCEEVGYLI